MSKKEETKNLFTAALKRGVKMADLARVTKVPRESLRQFKSNGSLGEEYLELLHAHLLATSSEEQRLIDELAIISGNLSLFLADRSTTVATRSRYLDAQLDAMQGLAKSLREAVARNSQSAD